MKVSLILKFSMHMHVQPCSNSLCTFFLFFSFTYPTRFLWWTMVTKIIEAVKFLTYYISELPSELPFRWRSRDIIFNSATVSWGYCWLFLFVPLDFLFFLSYLLSWYFLLSALASNPYYIMQNAWKRNFSYKKWILMIWESGKQGCLKLLGE